MKRVFFILIITFCYLSAFSQENDINQIRYEVFRNLKAGMAPIELVVRLGFTRDINRNFFGGIFIGIGLLSSEDSKKPSTYTGTLNLHEYKFIFDNGKLKEKSIDSTKIGSETISGQYIYEFIGKTQTSWSLVNGKFNSNTVAIEYTEEEKRIQHEQTEQKRIEEEKRLKEITDSLTNKGFKIITKEGFDSFEVGKTTLEEIINRLGANFVREDYKYHTNIIYPDLGVSFKLDKNKKIIGNVYSISFVRPFKGIYIIGDSDDLGLGIELNKTTFNDLKDYSLMSDVNRVFTHRCRDSCCAEFTSVLEKPVKGILKENIIRGYVINKITIYSKGRYSYL